MPTHFYVSPTCGLAQPSIIMLEQIRTIDKTRLDKYIGRLSVSEISGLNHALAISIGLLPTTPNKLILCLCSTCADKYFGSGAYYLRKNNYVELENDVCTYCNNKTGYPYELVSRKK